MRAPRFQGWFAKLTSLNYAVPAQAETADVTDHQNV